MLKSVFRLWKGNMVIMGFNPRQSLIRQTSIHVYISEYVKVLYNRDIFNSKKDKNRRALFIIVNIL